MSKRLGWLDCCKGATILLVVLGNIADGYLSAGAFLEHKTALLAIIISFTLSICPYFTVFLAMCFIWHIAGNEHKKRKISGRRL